jgi:hypothetical protein
LRQVENLLYRAQQWHDRPARLRQDSIPSPIAVRSDKNGTTGFHPVATLRQVENLPYRTPEW